jgi:hypothetical protein
MIQLNPIQGLSVRTGHLTDFTIGYSAAAGQGKCLWKLSEPEGSKGHERKFRMALL